MLSPIKKIIKGIIYRCSLTSMKFWALLFLKCKEDSVELEGIKRILVYGQMGIGNMVLFTPVLKALRNTFPDAYITLLVAKSGCEEVVAGSGLVDEIVKCKIEELPFLKRWLFIIKMSFRGYDLIISNFNGSRHYLVWLTLLSRAKYRVGHVTSGGWNNQYDFAYNHKVRITEGQHEIQMNLLLVEKIGIDTPDETPVFYIDNESQESGFHFLMVHGINEGDYLVAIQLGTSPTMRWKQWTVENYVRISEELANRFVATIIALGSPDERDLIEYAFQHSTIKPVLAAGEVSLKETAAIIKRCDLLLCNDSGLMHTAVAVNTPVVAIYGPTDYTRTAPLGEKHTVVRKNLPCSPCFKMDGPSTVESCERRICLENITVEEVLQVISKKSPYL